MQNHIITKQEYNYISNEQLRYRTKLPTDKYHKKLKYYIKGAITSAKPNFLHKNQKVTWIGIFGINDANHPHDIKF